MVEATWNEIIKIQERMLRDFDYMLYIEKGYCEIEGDRYFQKYDFEDYPSAKQAIQVALIAFAHWFKAV
jgi:hypothetical protein